MNFGAVLPESLEEILTAIRTNTEDGATQLAAKGLDALDAARLILPPESGCAEEALFDLVKRIGELRPTMGAIGVQALLACARARDLIFAGSAKDWPTAVQWAVHEERQHLKQADQEIAAIALNRIGQGKRIVTCSFSSTVLHTLVALKPTALFIGEGHPLGDGARAAGALAAYGFHTTLVSDTALANAVQAADAVLIGADQVLNGGAVVNRSSSFTIALAARHFQVPFYVACQRIKITGLDRSAVAIERCPKVPSDLPPNVALDAPLFDITPPQLISEILTEIGVLASGKVDALSATTAALREEITGGE